MTVKNRVRILKLSRQIEKNPDYAATLGVSVIYRTQLGNDEESNTNDQSYTKGEHKDE